MLAAVLRRRSLGAGLFLFGAGLGSITACSEAGTSGAEVVVGDRAAILNGEPSGREDDAVVMVVATTPTVTYRCTGTLIAPNLVITARHCVSDFDDLPFSCTDDGELRPGSPGGKMKGLYNPSQVSVRIKDGPNPIFGAQAAQFFAAETPSVCRNDIAVIVLDRELSDLPITPIRLRKGVQHGEELRVVGYGVDEAGISRIRNTLSGLVVTEVGSSQFRPSGDAVPPRTFVTEGPALCIGDSGGPAFVDQTVTVGVWSQVVGDCMSSTARNYFTEAAPFADAVILPAFEAAGAEPWLEGNSGPGLSTGGTVGTGGTGGAGGDTSTGGDGTSEGGTPGTGGTTDTGGSLSTGGLVGTGGDEPAAGAPALGGGAGLGGSASSGASGADGGLRKKGGCTCGVVGAPSGGSEFLLVPLAALALLRRRRPLQGG